MSAGEGLTIEQRVVVVRNRNGLHARPSSVLAEAALRFTDTELKLRKGGDEDGTEVDAKSIMELLLLAAGPGTELTLVASGPSAGEAIEAISGLFEREFDLDL